jgi:hypothetical protein
VAKAFCVPEGGDGVFRALKRRIGFKNALGEHGAKLAQVVEGRLHEDTSQEMSPQECLGKIAVAYRQPGVVSPTANPVPASSTSISKALDRDEF